MRSDITDEDRGDFFGMALIGRDIYDGVKDYPGLIKVLEEYGIPIPGRRDYMNDNFVDFARAVLQKREAIPLLLGLDLSSEAVLEAVLKNEKI